jgi:ribonuclease HII
VSPDLSWETQAGYPEVFLVGIDEVGRGCLAGPVMACALVLPPELGSAPWLSQVNDSKLLRPSVRKQLAPLLVQWSWGCALGMADVLEIDAWNIHHASLVAMERAWEGLRRSSSHAYHKPLSRKSLRVFHALVDGKWIPPGLLVQATSVVQGDRRCLSIAAASIVAKQARDEYMMDLGTRFPDYGFAQHKGYPTWIHKKALREHGLCDHHRRSFCQKK